MSLSSAYYSFLYEGFQDSFLRGAFVTDLLGDRNTLILEPHAGDGSVSLEISSRGYSVTALEDDPVLFAIFLEKFKMRRELRPFLSPLPLNLLDFETSNKWGLVLLSNTVSFIDDHNLNLYLNKVNQLLSMGGLLVLNSPQPTILRKEQPMEEIHKKVFGVNIIKHFASSKFLNDRTMEVQYAYETLSSGKSLTLLNHIQIMHLRDSKDLIKLLALNGFEVTSVVSDWNLNQLKPDSPNCVVVAKKISDVVSEHNG